MRSYDDQTAYFQSRGIERPFSYTSPTDIDEQGRSVAKSCKAAALSMARGTPAEAAENISAVLFDGKAFVNYDWSEL